MGEGWRRGEWVSEGGMGGEVSEGGMGGEVSGWEGRGGE